jgi:hypothetical protein
MLNVVMLECHVLFIVMLNVNVLSVIMQGVVVLIVEAPASGPGFQQQNSF